MAIEIEKKYLGADFGQLPGKLRELRAKSFGAHFETNIMFDFPGNSLLRKKACAPEKKRMARQGRIHFDLQGAGQD